jgi:hypothetical protein
MGDVSREANCSSKEFETASCNRVSPVALRLQKGAKILKDTDLSELCLPETVSMAFADPDDLLHFEVQVAPDEGTDGWMNIRNLQKRKVHFRIQSARNLSIRSA